MFALRLDAGNDRNGNPRRVYVIFAPNGDVIDTVDEGYAGRGALGQYRKIGDGGTIATTPAEYRNLVKLGEARRAKSSRLLGVRR